MFFFIFDSKPEVLIMSESSENHHATPSGPHLSYVESPCNYVINFRLQADRYPITPNKCLKFHRVFLFTSKSRQPKLCQNHLKISMKLFKDPIYSMLNRLTILLSIFDFRLTDLRLLLKNARNFTVFFYFGLKADSLNYVIIIWQSPCNFSRNLSILCWIAWQFCHQFSTLGWQVSDYS